MISKLLIITTGGTIDKIYFDDKSDYQVGEPQISQILHAMHVAFEFEVTDRAVAVVMRGIEGTPFAEGRRAEATMSSR